MFILSRKQQQNNNKKGKPRFRPTDSTVIEAASPRPILYFPVKGSCPLALIGSVVKWAFRR
jgi:hypothetical protein